MTKYLDFELELIWEVDLHQYVDNPPPKELFPPVDISRMGIADTAEKKEISNEWVKFVTSPNYESCKAALTNYETCNLDSIAADSTGTVFVGDNGNAAIWKISATGEVKARIDCTVPKPRPTPKYRNPRVDQVCVDGTDSIYCLDRTTPKNRILKFRIDGAFLGESPLEKWPHRIFCDSLGKLWIAGEDAVVQQREFAPEQHPIVISTVDFSSGKIPWEKKPGLAKLADWMARSGREAEYAQGKDGTLFAIPATAPYRLLAHRPGDKLLEREIQGVDDRKSSESAHGAGHYYRCGSGIGITPLVRMATYNPQLNLVCVGVNGAGHAALDLLGVDGNYFGTLDLKFFPTNFCFGPDGFLLECNAFHTKGEARVAKYRLGIKGLSLS